MADELSELNFAQELSEVLGVEDAKRWKIEKAGVLEIYVELFSAKTPEEKFQVRLRWDTYPGLASLKFRDPQTGQLDIKTAWPNVRGFRPQNLDACVNWCIEGFNLHPEWRTDPEKKWNNSGNVMLKTLRILQSEMDNHFGGRFKQ